MSRWREKIELLIKRKWYLIFGLAILFFALVVIVYFVFPLGEKLAEFEIKISQENWAKLNSDLPKSGDEYVRGEMILPTGEKVDADLRYRGGGNWHWKYKQKSWRVKLKDNSDYKNQGYLNFISPKDRCVVIDAVDYYFAEKIGLLTPKHEFIKLLINGEYYGVYSMVEQINEDFLKNHGRKISDVYDGEPEIGAFREIVENKTILPPDLGIFANHLFWPKKVSETGKDSSDYSALEQLIKVIKEKETERFYEGIDKIADIDKFLRYIAFLNLQGTFHVNNFHNLKVYYDPDKKKFEPISWDVSGLTLTTSPTRPFGRTENYFFDYLLKVPEYNYLKNKYVWEFMQKEMSLEKLNKVIDEESVSIREPLRKDPYKDYVLIVKDMPSTPLSMEEWEKALKDTKDWMKKRYEYIDGLLKKAEVKIYYKVDGELLKMMVEVSGYPSVKMEILRKDFEVNRDLNFDNEFGEGDLLLKDKQILLHPGIKIVNDGIVNNFLRTTPTPSPLRYGFFVKLGKGMSAEKVLDGKAFVLKNAFTDELIRPEINKVDDFKSLPEIKSDSLHPWRQN